MAGHTHAQLCETVETIFNQILSNYIPGQTTAQYIEQTVSEYVKDNFEMGTEEELYTKALIGDISYMNVSDILDDLMFHSVLEKCCKYDETNKILLTVLITSEANSQ